MIRAFLEKWWSALVGVLSVAAIAGVIRKVFAALERARAQGRAEGRADQHQQDLDAISLHKKLAEQKAAAKASVEMQAAALEHRRRVANEAPTRAEWDELNRINAELDAKRKKE